MIQKLEMTVLIDNVAEEPLAGEWGLSILIAADGRKLLLDTGSSGLFARNADCQGIDLGSVDIGVLSHAHYDHAGAAEALRRYTGAQLWLGRDDVPFIGHPELLLADPCNCPDFQVDACYEPGQPICLGRFSIRAEHTPGHTPGAHSFFFEDTANGRTILCGMHGGLGFNTMSDAFLDSVHLPHSLRQDFLQGLERLREYPVQLAIGSHPSVFHMLERWQEHTPGVNPFADDGSTWRAGMEDRIAAFRKQFPDA